ncbi:MAG: tryptophan 7-halogenase, partial [bacterium]|nr:tryptophan 7-halogenase [bacterium]
MGGGTAGWLTASLLRRHLGGDRHDITLVESPGVPTIGVGEASVPTLVRALRALGIDERSWLEACDATFKLAIRFDGWTVDSSPVGFWHPFGRIGGAIDEVDFFHHWVRQRADSGEARRFTDFSLQVALCEAGRGPMPPRGGGGGGPAPPPPGAPAPPSAPPPRARAAGGPPAPRGAPPP